MDRMLLPATAKQTKALVGIFLEVIEELFLTGEDAEKLLLDDQLGESLSRAVREAVLESKPAFGSHAYITADYWRNNFRSDWVNPLERLGRASLQGTGLEVTPRQTRRLQRVFTEVLGTLCINRDDASGLLRTCKLEGKLKKALISVGKIVGTRKVAPIKVPAHDHASCGGLIDPDPSMKAFACREARPATLPMKLWVHAVVENAPHSVLFSSFGERAEIGLGEMFEVVRQGLLDYENFPHFVTIYTRNSGGVLYAVEWTRFLSHDKWRVSAHHVTPEDPGEWHSGWWIITH